MGQTSRYSMYSWISHGHNYIHHSLSLPSSPHTTTHHSQHHLSSLFINLSLTLIITNIIIPLSPISVRHPVTPYHLLAPPIIVSSPMPPHHYILPLLSRITIQRSPLPLITHKLHHRLLLPITNDQSITAL